MKKIWIAVTCVLVGAAVLPAQPTTKQTSSAAGLGKREAATNEDLNIRANIELLRTDLRNSKSQIMGEVMQLDAAEAAKFWPIYKDFEAEYSKLGEQVVAVVKDYAEHYAQMTDDVAAQLGNSALNIEQQRNDLKRKYFERPSPGSAASGEGTLGNARGRVFSIRGTTPGQGIYSRLRVCRRVGGHATGPDPNGGYVSRRVVVRGVRIEAQRHGIRPGNDGWRLRLQP